MAGFSNLANVDIPTQKRLILNTSHTRVKWRDIKLFNILEYIFRLGRVVLNNLIYVEVSVLTSQFVISKISTYNDEIQYYTLSKTNQR